MTRKRPAATSGIEMTIGICPSQEKRPCLGDCSRVVNWVVHWAEDLAPPNIEIWQKNRHLNMQTPIRDPCMLLIVPGFGALCCIARSPQVIDQVQQTTCIGPSSLILWQAWDGGWMVSVQTTRDFARPAWDVERVPEVFGWRTIDLSIGWLVHDVLYADESLFIS
ncbi:hypothetical protein BKA66DRAFT_435928 [Pyrenochaeta sp. MPI-SDFR-AT-0127]|nr:hypothetical protein BKA66DRAFT_435928 [Pyrenochaeta sp. MPI-SDFR-AT-0127]